jgi:hypothetical protein
LDSFLIPSSPQPINAKRDPCRLGDLKWRGHFEISDAELPASFVLLALASVTLCRTEISLSTWLRGSSA